MTKKRSSSSLGKSSSTNIGGSGSGGLINKASMNLVALNDRSTWEKVEDHCRNVIDTIPNLRQHESILATLGSTKSSFNKSELDQVVLWKHTVGKNRIYNVKYLNSNTEESIQYHSSAAISLAKSIILKDCVEKDGSLNQTGRAAVQEAVGELGKLKGVGPATASAILTLIRPDVFCYLYDEVIDCFEPQRDYKMANYLRVNNRCLQLAKALGDGWTTSRIAKTIWTAARFLAVNGVDLTEDTGAIAPGGDAANAGGAAAGGNAGNGMPPPPAAAAAGADISNGGASSMTNDDNASAGGGGGSVAGSAAAAARGAADGPQGDGDEDGDDEEDGDSDEEDEVDEEEYDEEVMLDDNGGGGDSINDDQNKKPPAAKRQRN